jgi:uncharacterized repeat protein (TIGR03943 family)
VTDASVTETETTDVAVTNPSAVEAEKADDGGKKTDGAGSEPDLPDLDELFVADMYTEDFALLAKELYQQDGIGVTEKLFMEILTSIDLFLDQFQGKTMEIGGFVYREEEMNPNQFVIGRFAMDCCTADALPYGLLAEYGKAGRYENDAWIQIRGTIGKTEYLRNTIMVVHPTATERIEEPGSPYAYPNYNF